MNQELLNQQLAEVAEIFAGTFKCALEPERDLLLASELSRNKLNFSIESLHAVDQWLSALYSRKINVESDEAAESIIWCGAYIGEVIRRNSNNLYLWAAYTEYMDGRKDSLRSIIPYNFGTQFLLVTASGKVTLPINKVCRWLDEGPENNIHFYAQAELHRAKIQ